MQLSKLSKNTYHKSIKELHEAKYIYYHPAASKFQVVRISIIRLDTEEQSNTKYQQLDLFSSYSPPSGGVGGGGRKIETDSVANLSPTSPNIETVPVANLGHLINQTNKQERKTPSQEIFKKNKKIQEEVNDMAGVSNLGHITLGEVEVYFDNNNYPGEEAKKFFNHYKALGWKIQGKTPIEDWKALVEKWMMNAKKWNSNSDKPTSSAKGDVLQDIQYLYEFFLEGKQISKQILAEYFDYLQLQLTEEIKQQAWQKRINQLTGSNENSITILWQAYVTNNPDEPLIKKDKPYLISLAKRIAVLSHFQQSKDSGIKLITHNP